MIDARGARLVAIADGVRAGKLRAREVTEQFLDRIARLDGALGCYLLVDADGARAPGRRGRRRPQAGRDPGPLAGVPIGIKDIFVHARARDHLRLEDPARLRAALRVDGDRAPGGGRRGRRSAS